MEPVGFEDVHLYYMHEARREEGRLVGARGWLGALRSVLGIAVLESGWVVRQPGRLMQDAFMALSFALILWAWGAPGR